MARDHATFAATATLAGALAVAAVLTTDRAEALAGHACLPQAELLAQQLGTQYGEHLVAAGVDANGGLLQVYSNAESGTWTIAVTMPAGPTRSEEHTSELQSLMRISYAVFCLTKKNNHHTKSQHIIYKT